MFWFGDLNFRIEDYDIHVVKCAIDSNKLPLLWERDQVRRLHFGRRGCVCVCLLVTTHQHQQRASPPPVLHSSTWLKPQSQSWTASARGSSTFPPLTSLTWAPTRTTPGGWGSHPSKFGAAAIHFTVEICLSWPPLTALKRGNLRGRIASSGAFVVRAPPFLPTMQRCSAASLPGWVVPPG